MTGAFVLSFAELAEAVQGVLLQGDGAARVGSVSTDTRTLASGDTFVALAGPSYDGHAFLETAAERGAAGALVEPSRVARFPAGLAVVAVADTLRALQDLAHAVRKRVATRVVAITGSAGKTTTKEALAAMLATRYSTVRNKGNLNNHIGLPLSLLDLRAAPDYAVLELGMNHAGEIRRLVEIAEPDVRVWTNVGTAHLEFFGTREAIADAKAEVLENAATRTLAVVNADDPLVMARVAGFSGRLLTFGFGKSADIRAHQVVPRGFDGTRARVATPIGELELDVPLPGMGHVLNMLAATGVAVEAGIEAEAIATTVKELAPVARRGEVHRRADGTRIVDDSYNASPSALDMMLEVMAHDPAAGRRVAFLGEMLELGAQSAALHREAGRKAVEAGAAVVVAVGGDPARALRDGAVEAGLDPAAARYFESSAAAAAEAAVLVGPGDLVVVKGSRGTRMERVVDALLEEAA
jgi:UDP-N-acetylmuramoyl-tripeptide--D-alanyl-D-alanine ligase